MSRRVLVVSNDHVGSQDGRARASGRITSRRSSPKHFSVTLAAPDASDIALDGVELVTVQPTDSRALTMLALEHDAVVSQRLPINTALRLAASHVRSSTTCTHPCRSRCWRSRAMRRQASTCDFTSDTSVLCSKTTLATGDAFICASDRQRDLWLGWLGALGRLDATRHARDTSFRGADRRRAVRDRRRLRRTRACAARGRCLELSRTPRFSSGREGFGTGWIL